MVDLMEETQVTINLSIETTTIRITQEAMSPVNVSTGVSAILDQIVDTSTNARTVSSSVTAL